MALVSHVTARTTQPDVVIMLQKECIISKTKKISVGSFGPCYVLTGHDPKTKYSFAAHIDDCTQVETVSEIFNKLKELGVDLNDLTDVKVMGGWKNVIESAKWGTKLIEQLKNEGIYSKVNFSLFQKKQHCSGAPDLSKVKEFYFLGGQLNSENGVSQFFTKSWMKIENLQDEVCTKIEQEIIQEKFPGKKREDFSFEDIQKIVSPYLVGKEYPLQIFVV